MSEELANKVALVSGAGKGMGEAIAKALAAEGAAVGVVDVDAEAAAFTVAAIEAAGGRSIAVPADVRQSDAVKEAVDTVAGTYGGLDIVVNSAGVARIGMLPEFSEDDWDFVLDTNLKGMFLTARFAIPYMRRRGGGVFVNIASVQAFWSQQGACAYAASKAGAVAFTRVLALDHAREGIRAVSIAPGSVRTPMLMSEANRMSPENPQAALDMWADSHPIGRLIEPEEIANTVVFLASGKAPAITGSMLVIDGAITAGPGSW